MRLKSRRRTAQITLDYFNTGKKVWGREEVPFKLLAGGVIRLKAAVIGFKDDSSGAAISSESMEYRVKLPKPSKLTPAQRRFRNKISKYVRKRRQRIRRRSIRDGTRDADREQRRKRQEKWKWRNSPAGQAYMKKYQQEHKDELKKYGKKW